MSWPESDDWRDDRDGDHQDGHDDQDGHDGGDQYFEKDDGHDGHDGGDRYFEDDDGRRWPLTWRSLYPRERWLWFEQLWSDVCALRERYRLSVRSGWWEDDVQVEALAALAAWTDRYDSGEWDDPPGKLGLLFDLERVAGLLRDGLDPFHPERDRAAFLRHLLDLGCQPPPESGAGRR